MLRRFALPFLALAVLATACTSGSQDVDFTAGEISDDQLALMALTLEEFGPAFADFEADEEDTGFLTLEEAADDLDPQDGSQELERFGWVSEYNAEYVKPRAAQDEGGAFVVSNGVALFETAGGAAGYLAGITSELRASVGETREGVTLERLETFEADVSDEALGARVLINVEERDLHLWISGLSFRRGRLVADVSIGSFEERSLENDLKDLARKLDQRILGVLRGEVTAKPTAEPTAEPYAPAVEHEKQDDGSVGNFLTAFDPLSLLGSLGDTSLPATSD